MALPAGTRVGPYELVELLGAGGMGEVYRARDPRLGRHVAVKVLPERFAHSADRLTRFEREARAAGSLSHPNVLTVFDVGAQDGIFYLVTELLEGETLQALVRYQRVGVRQSLLLALQAARGLASAHEAGILHRDLKPGNLFLTRDGRLKILDFGLAKLVHSEGGVSPEARTATHDTEAGKLLGTAAYMSPEQIRDEPLDGRSDIFALGAILYELLSGRPAFAGASESDVMASVLRDEPLQLAEVGAVVPAGVESLVRRCLEKRREDRFGSARELASALQALLETLEPGASLTDDGAGDLRAELRSFRPSKSPAAPTLIAPSPGRVRRARVVTTLAAATVATISGLFLLARWRVAAPAPQSNSLAVMYFENLSDRTDADNLGRMLAGLLTTELAGSDGLQVVSSQRLYDITRQLGRAEGNPDRNVATDVAKRAGAARMVLGQVARAGSRMVATAELVEVGSGRRLGSYRAEGRSTQDVFSMAEGLGAHLRAYLTGRPRQPGDGVSLTRQLSASADAYRAYMSGEGFLRRWEFEKAAEEFRKAVTIDPEFALAHYRFSIAASPVGQFKPEVRAAAERAAALKDRLPPSERDLVQANLLYMTGRLSEAITLLEAALGRDPEHKDVLYLLSECYAHSPQDSDPRRAAELVERLLALDPEFHTVYNHLAIAYAQLGEFAKARERLDAWEAKEPAIVRDARGLVSAFEGRLDDALRWSEQSEGSALLWRAEYGLGAGRLEIPESIVRKYGSRADDLLGSLLRFTRFCLHMYRGEFGQAEAVLRRILPARLEPDNATWRNAELVTPLLGLARLAEVKGDLLAARREAERALAIQPKVPLCLYFAGLFAIRAGDLPAGERHLRTLEEVVSVARGPLVPHYRHALAAEIALARGRPLEAQPLLENAVGSGKLFYDFWNVMPGDAFRDGLARSYLAVGDKEKAAEVLAALVSSRFDRDPLLSVRALYTLGKLKLELGDQVRGRELLRQFLEHWGKADWDLPEVREARALLASSGS